MSRPLNFRFLIPNTAWPLMAVLCGLFSPVYAQVYLTQEDAMSLHYPGATSTKKTLYLTDLQASQIESAARSKLTSKIITYYRCTRNDSLLGWVFFDTEVIRTQKAAYMVGIGPGGDVKSVEILAFYEPEDYLPPKKWLTRLEGKKSSDDLFLKRGVPNISGATISAQAISSGVRRFLALHQLIIPKD